MLTLLDLSKMCRVCRDESDCLLDLFVDSWLPNKEQEPNLAVMLSKCSGCQVGREDGFPQFVCADCAASTRVAFRLRQQCRKSVHYFKQLRCMEDQEDCMKLENTEELDKTPEVQTPSQEASNAIGLKEPEVEEFHEGEFALEPLFVELVTSPCEALQNLENENELQVSPMDTTITTADDKESPESSSDNESTGTEKRSNSGSSSDDYWSPTLRKNTTKKTRPGWKRFKSYSGCSSDDSSKKTKKGKNFQCSKCEASFDSKLNLLMHQREHTGVRPYQCTHCPRSFTQKGNLQTHIRIHTGERPFKCTQCSLTFKQSGHLDVHLRAHNGQKPFKCSYCSYACIQKSNLKSHVRSAHRGC